MESGRSSGLLLVRPFFHFTPGCGPIHLCTRSEDRGSGPKISIIRRGIKGLQSNQRLIIYGVLTLFDPSVILTWTQHAAIPGNRGNRIPLNYAGFANLVQAPATPELSLVMGMSAVRARSSALFDSLGRACPTLPH